MIFLRFIEFLTAALRAAGVTGATNPDVELADVLGLAETMIPPGHSRDPRLRYVVIERPQHELENSYVIPIAPDEPIYTLEYTPPPVVRSEYITPARYALVNDMPIRLRPFNYLGYSKTIPAIILFIPSEYAAHILAGLHPLNRPYRPAPAAPVKPVNPEDLFVAAPEKSKRGEKPKRGGSLLDRILEAAKSGGRGAVMVTPDEFNMLKETPGFAPNLADTSGETGYYAGVYLVIDRSPDDNR